MTKTSLVVLMLHFQSSPHTIPKKSRKKRSKAIEADSNIEIISKNEIIYEDTKAITGDY